MKKGFTLIELLGVLAILGILAVITVPIIQGLLESGEENSKNMQIESFEKAARSWAGTHVFDMPAADIDESKELCLDELIEDGYLDALNEDTKTSYTYSDSNYYIKVNGRDDTYYDLYSSCFTIKNDGSADKANYEYTFTERIIDKDGNLVTDENTSTE